MPDNKFLNSPEGEFDTGLGSGVMIGDGIMLTAGHVMFEFNERDDPAERQIRELSGSDIYWDPRDYYSQYFTKMMMLSNPLPQANPGATISGQFIEAFLTSDDMVFVTKSGTVDDSDAGMALYLNPSEIASSNGALVDGTLYQRWGQTTNMETVAWGDINLSSTGISWVDASAHLQPGDSGGANWIKFEGEEYIVGNNVSIRRDPTTGATTQSNASYITATEFYGLHSLMLSGQLGDVTTEEPTNLIVGSSGADTNANGTYRPDIILGKDGDDVLWDGETADALVWADDQLFGGGGNDTFRAANGNDLLHGGDYRKYAGASARTWAIEADGTDSVDYSDFLNIPRSSDDPGLELRIGSAAGSPTPTWVYGDNTDENLASYVIDRQNDASNAYSFGTDALISIEKVTLSASDDVLTVNEIGTDRWAGQDGNGGIASVDFGDNAAFKGTDEKPGDLIDASNLAATDKVLIDLAEGKLSPVPGKGPSGSVPTITISGAESAYGGAGADVLTGDDNGNRLSGGLGSDKLVGGGGDDFIVFDQEDSTVDGGAGFDTAILSAGEDAQGNAIGATFDANGLGISNFERLVGTEGDDQITVAGGSLIVNGGDGDDYISVSGPDPLTIEFGRGGGNDYVAGLFMENHDLSAPTLHDIGENPWLGKRQNDTIKFVDLMPSDVSLVWDFDEIYLSNYEPPIKYRDGGFAIVINDTGESIQFAELQANLYFYEQGTEIVADYGPYTRKGSTFDMIEDDPDNPYYSDPDLYDNVTHLDIFEFADGSRYSVVELFQLDTAQSAPLPISRANPNQPAAMTTSLSFATLDGDSSDDATLLQMRQSHPLEHRSQPMNGALQSFATVVQAFDMIRSGRGDLFGLVPDSPVTGSLLPESSIAQRLAMMRQAMSVFGASASGQISARNWQESHAMELFAAS